MTLPELDEIFEQYISPHEPGLGAAVYQAGRVVHLRGYGLANLEWQIPVEGDTVFKLGALTKPLTALGILLLNERGALLLDDPVTDYLPHYHTSGHEITLRHLLNHTSGIPDTMNQPNYWEALCQRPITSRQLADIAASMPVRFKPGTRHAYSNSNYVLLGLVIEAVSGMPYGEFMRRSIFEPLEMADTQHLDQDKIVPRMATGYMLAAGNTFIRPPFIHISQTFAAGSIVSTLSDMVKLAHALDNDQLLSPDTLQLAIRDTHLEGGRAGYGLGWGLADYEGRHVIWHRGGLYGFRAFIARVPQEDMTVILLSNAVGRVQLEDLGVAAMRVMFGLERVKHRPYILMGDGLRKAMGMYRANGGGVMVRVDAESQIIVQRGDETARLVPIGRDKFHVVDRPEHLYNFSDEDSYAYNTLTYRFPFMVEPIVYQRVSINNMRGD